MSLLNKKLLRDLRAHKAQVLAVLVIVILGTVIFTTLLLVPRSLDNSLNRIFTRTKYEAFKVQVAGAPPGTSEELLAIPGVSAVQGTMETETSATVKGKELTLRIVSVPDAGRASVNDLMLESGRYADVESGLAGFAERHLTAEFGLVPGDSVSLLVGGREVPVRVAGSVTSPRFLRLVENQSTFLSDPSQFGVVFMSESNFRKVFGTGAYDTFAFRTTSPGVKASAMKAATAALHPSGVIGANTGAEEQSTRLIEMDLKNEKNIAVFFTLIFLWVSSLAIYITLARIIYTEQRQIGTARALGYTKRTMIKHFLQYGLALGVAGGVLGVVAGIFTGRATVHMYAGTLGLPPVQAGAIPWDLMAAGVALAVVLSMLGAALPAIRSARIMPVAAMRMDAGVSLAAPPPVKAGPARRKLLPSWFRFPMRNLWRNRKRTILTGLGLVLTLGTLITVNGAMTSINHMVSKQFSQVAKWDVAAYLPEPKGHEFLARVAAMPGVTRVEPAIESPAQLSAGGAKTDVDLQAYQRDTVMHGLFPAGGSTGAPGPGGMLVNRSLQRQVPMKIGDNVSVATPVGTTAFKIEGFVREPLGVGCYIDLAYIQRALGSDAFNLALVKVVPGAGPRVASALRHTPGVYKVELKRDTILAMEGTLSKAIRPMFNIVLVMILGIGFAIVFTMVSITMLERRQEIATMLTLGTGTPAVARSMLIETIAIGAVVLVPGIVLGTALCWVLMNKILSSSTTQLAPEMWVSALSVAGICVAFLLLMAISILPAARQLSKMDLATAARERTT